jgi:hypothetical protein
MPPGSGRTSTSINMPLTVEAKLGEANRAGAIVAAGQFCKLWRVQFAWPIHGSGRIFPFGGISALYPPVAVARDGVSVSAWMTSAALEALRRRAGLAAVAP